MTAPLPRPPAELTPLAEAIGAEALLRLIEQRGGTAIYVAKEPNQGTDLALVIGLDAARKLAATHGGDWLRVPLARDWRIRAYRARGASVRVIARKLGVHETTVERHLTHAGLTNRQPDLFG